MIFRPSGGVLYHWRAFRRRAHWKPFVRELEKWLMGWNSGSSENSSSARSNEKFDGSQASDDRSNSSENFELILIGPSGGYTLPPDWLKRFSKIYAYDLDPLAPLLFRRVHPGAKVKFVSNIIT